MRLLGFAIAVTLIAFVAQADEICDCQRDCAKRSDPTSGMTYEDEEHRLWYEVRFWTGRCEGEIWLACWSGEDWYDVMSEVISQGEAADRGEMCRRLFDLGVRMGHEWARDNAIREIHTSDLDAWQDKLLKSDDPMRAIADVEALVDARLE